MGGKIRGYSNIMADLGMVRKTRYEKPDWDSIATLDLRTITNKRMASAEWEQDKRIIERYFYDLEMESNTIRGRIDYEGYIKQEDMFEYRIEGNKLIREGTTIQGRRFKNEMDLKTALKIGKKDYLALHKGLYLHMKYDEDIITLESLVGTGRSPIQHLTIEEREYEGIKQKSIRRKYDKFYDNAIAFISGYDNLYKMVAIAMPDIDRDRYWYNRKGKLYLRKDKRLIKELAVEFVKRWNDLSDRETGSPVAAILQQKLLGAVKDYMDIPQGQTIAQTARELTTKDFVDLLGLQAVDATVTFAEHQKEGKEPSMEQYFDILKGISVRRKHPNLLTEYARDMIDTISEDKLVQMIASSVRRRIGK